MQALRFPILSTAAALALCAVAATDAHAAPGAISSGPANYCRPALPAFEGQIRTRPLAMQNEGNSTAFVTCSMGSLREFGTEADTVEYEVTVSNNSNQQREIICTAVSGRVGAPGSIQTSTKGFSLAPGGSGVLEWNNDNFSGPTIPLVVSYSCQLPPGGAINDMYVLYDDGV
jgi:hypothetical protein